MLGLISILSGHSYVLFFISYHLIPLSDSIMLNEKIKIFSYV